MNETVVIIPARGGSKGIPLKNIKLFAGKPLIVHTIEHALNTPQVDAVYVSTDDTEIVSIAKRAGARTILRPTDISGDSATSESAVRHFLDILDSDDISTDMIVLMQATSPFRPVDALSKAIDHFILSRLDSLLTLSQTHHFFWTIDGDRAIPEYDYLNRPRRQDMDLKDIRYAENGSFYIFTHQLFNKTGNRLGGKIGYYLLPEKYSLQIDTELDFSLLEKTFLENEDK
ncbi:MAG: acylneuraminate cytidylyltransferase family protein [Candidatus Marinimicrobia bacterium]|nr:acylneuraminate cytidylyltransferase family protein [Candidatus Neomarinimicrobiota bacterium]